MEEKIKSLIKDVIEENNYILDDVEYVKEESVYFLRVIIDKVGIMDVEDCVTVSNLINPILDKEDPIEENYILDVCSKEKGSEEDE
jgi:ribosome maturation factor RimP